jgi:hypothetical protein
MNFYLNRAKSIYKRLIKIKEIIKIILRQTSNPISNFKKLETDANEELDTFYEEIKILIKNDKINDKRILENMDLYKDPSKYNSGPTDNKFIVINFIQIALYNNIKTRSYKLSMKAPEGVPISLDKIALYEKLYPKTWNWLMQRSDFWKTNEGLNYKAIKKIEDFYNCYNFNKPPNKLNKNNINLFYKSRSTLITGYIFGKQREYYDSINEASLPFSSEEFKQYAGRILNAIEENFPIEENIEHTKYIWEYSSDTAELIINNKVIKKHMKNKNPYYLFKYIDKQFKAKRKKTITLLDVYNKIFRSEHDKLKKLNPNQIKEIRDLINKQNSEIKAKNKPDFFVIQENQYNKNSFDLLISSLYQHK